MTITFSYPIIHWGEQIVPHLLRHVAQPPGSKLCGQACIASLLDVPLDVACTLVGHRKGTSTRELCRALGIPFMRRMRVTGFMPDLALLTVRYRTNGKTVLHWVLKDGDVIMDPTLPYRVDLDGYRKHLAKEHARISSHLDLTPYWQSIKETQ